MEKVISDKELQERLHWTLAQKIDHSLYIIENFLAQNPEAIVSYSGGLDSTVLLHLTRIVDKYRKGVFCNTTNEFTEIVKFVKQTENIDIVLPKITFVESLQKYGFPLISKKVSGMLEDLQHPSDKNENVRRLYLTRVTKDGNKSRTFILPNKYRYLIEAPFNFTDTCCYYLKKKPMRKPSKNGILIGTKSTDSRLRQLNYQKMGCINNVKRKATPLSIWTNDDIWKFVHQYNLKYCDVYKNGEMSTGCAYCGFGIQFDTQRFKRLKEKEPKRYEKMMRIKNNGVPYADAIRMVLQGSCSLQPQLFDL